MSTKNRFVYASKKNRKNWNPGTLLYTHNDAGNINLKTQPSVWWEFIARGRIHQSRRQNKQPSSSQRRRARPEGRASKSSQLRRARPGHFSNMRDRQCRNNAFRPKQFKLGCRFGKSAETHQKSRKKCKNIWFPQKKCAKMHTHQPKATPDYFANDPVVARGCFGPPGRKWRIFVQNSLSPGKSYPPRICSQILNKPEISNLGRLNKKCYSIGFS